MYIHTHTAGDGKCGRVFPIPEKGGMGVYAYNATGGALAQGDVVVMAYNKTAGRELSADSVATTTFPVRTMVAMEAISDGSIGKFQFAGLAEVKCGDGSNAITAGKFLEVLNGNSYAEEDGASRTTVSIGVLKDAVAASDSAALKTVCLIPEQHTIAGS